jgi:hypothetical protein
MPTSHGAVGVARFGVLLGFPEPRASVPGTDLAAEVERASERRHTTGVRLVRSYVTIGTIGGARRNPVRWWPRQTNSLRA